MSNDQISRRAVLALLSAAAAPQLVACGGSAPSAPTSAGSPGSTRPRFNLAPPTAWMNDPQRPLWLNGSWHLWVLWNADYPTSGGTAWRHYTSTDLVSWTDQGISIPKYTTAQGDAWTGSTVIDTADTAGYGAGAVIALLTQPCNDSAGQNQSTCLWYSVNGGTTFTFGAVVMPNYPGNNSVFRDPSVFWHVPTQEWVMSLAENGKIGIYKSSNLKQWRYASGLLASDVGTMECPNLFPLHLYDSAGTIVGDKWVMLCAAAGGASRSAAGTCYWIGSFDGTTFAPDSASGHWLDQGPDFYATTIFADPNATDPLASVHALAWMNNWDYASRLPDTGYYGQLSVTRELHLRTIDGVATLFNAPVANLNSVFTSQSVGADQTISDSVPYGFPTWAKTPACRIDFTLGPANGIWPASVFLSFRGGNGYFSQIGFDIGNGSVFLKRNTSGPSPTADAIWNNNYGASLKFTAPVDVSILIDTGSVEMFANDGQVAISALLTAPVDATDLRLTASGGSASISGLTIHAVA